MFYCSLAEDYGNNKRWIFFCEDETIVNLPGLVRVLNKQDARKVSWETPPQMGHSCANYA